MTSVILAMQFLWITETVFADIWRGAKQHPHHRRSGQGEELRGNVPGPAGRSVQGRPEKGQRVRSVLRLRAVHHLPDQLRLLQVWRLPGAAGRPPLQPGVQVNVPSEILVLLVTQ